MVVDAEHHRNATMTTNAVVAATTTLLVIASLSGLPRPAPRRPVVPEPVTTHGGRARRMADRRRRLAELVVGPRRRRRHRRAVENHLPDVIEMLVLAVHAGSSPAQAVDQVRPLLTPTIRPAFDMVVHRLQRGRALADAVGALPEILGHRAIALADGIAAADRYGLPLGPVLDGLAEEARADRRRLGEAHARSLSVKLSFPLVACTLPAFVLIAIVPAVIGSLASLPTSPLRP
jgi:Flp pilus assembly protein TadB